MRGIALLISCGLVLAGCGGRALVPVADHSTKQAVRTHYWVGSGDTLYSIAWIVGIDYKVLAAWNDVRPPYTIYPGQSLRLTRPAGFSVTNNSRSAQSSAPKPKPGPKPVATTASSRPAPTTVRAPALPNKPVARWLWPADGHVIEKFSVAAGNKGIDISGREGQAVRASAAGQIVYAGSGLRGYGNLIIIKHNDTFLSAYAHNRTIAVSEGQSVKQGQKIAEMGSSGASRVKLHFELRKNGSPVNPVKYLPKKTG